VGNSNLPRLALRRRLIAAALAALSLAAPGALARPLDDVKKSGTLRVTVYRDYKPYSYEQDGKFLGVDVTIAEALAKSLGVRLDLYMMLADDNLGDDLRNGVWKGTVLGEAPGDVMMHIPYDKRIEQTNDKVVLAAPYHIDGLAMATEPANAEKAQDFSLFLKEKVAVDVGTLADMIAISAHDQQVMPNVVHFRGVDKAVAAFERGEVAGVYGEASGVEAYLKKGQRPFALVFPKSKLSPDWPIGVAVKSDSKDLGAAVEAALNKMQTSGELAKAFADYGVDWRKPEVN
jgi:ABC-type amino acid transport substrate-binding protein